MDLFAEMNIAPMLIAQMQEPFNDSDWIYELKLDGCRCIAYLEKDKTILRNKRNMELLPRFPELKDIYSSVTDRCILDGELVVMINGVPEFYELQKRTLMTNPVKISFASERLPASFVAYDCLQVNDRVLLDTPLMERKVILQELVRENERIAISRYIEEKGTELYALTVQKELEGVVAKRKNSFYFQGKRTKDWIKFKRMADKEFVICGYEPGQMTSLILGEYREGTLEYAGTVTMGVRRELTRILKKSTCPFTVIPQEKEQVVWCKPEYIGTVEYMPNTMDALRQPVFKGIRDDVG